MTPDLTARRAMKSPARQGGSAQGTVYVDMKQEKFLFPDNRRGIRFFVVDANGKSTLAVLGEERDTRDGHYTYRKQPDFPAGSNLVCGNVSRNASLRASLFSLSCSPLALHVLHAVQRMATQNLNVP